MKNFVKKGDEFKITAASAISSGDLVLVSQLPGVAIKDAAIGEETSIYIEGVYDVVKKAAVVFAQGDVVYFEANEGSDVVGVQVGYAVEAAAGGDATVRVKLDR